MCISPKLKSFGAFISSDFIFSAISYIFDVYRKDVKVQSVQNVHNVHNVQSVETQVEENNEISEDEKNAWFDNLWK